MDDAVSAPIAMCNRRHAEDVIGSPKKISIELQHPSQGLQLRTTHKYRYGARYIIEYPAVTDCMSESASQSKHEATYTTRI
jgi:hypothetical protein